MAVKLQSLLTLLGSLKSTIARGGYRYRYFMYPILLITALSTITAILAYSSIGQSLYHSTSHEVTNSKINFLLDETILSIGLLAALVLGLTAYLIIDYRQHKKPLKAELPSVQYGLLHHIKVVSLPLLRYHWRPLSYSVAMGTSSFVVMAVTLLVVAPHIFAFSGSGAGTSQNPYQIATCDQLQEIETNLTAHYTLANDIDCSATNVWNSGWGFTPISIFSGELDGNDHIIHDFHINYWSTSGLFQFIDTTGVVKNLTLKGTITSSGSGAGIFVGSIASQNLGTIRSVHADVDISSSTTVGGLVADNHGLIEKSYSSGNISLLNATGVGSAGGLVGVNGTPSQAGVIRDSYATGSITGVSNAYWRHCGGLIGTALNSTIQRTYSSGSVSCPSSDSSASSAGLVGYGGGYTQTVEDSFSASSVIISSSENGSGFFGATSSDLSSNYFDVSRTGQTDGGGNGIGQNAVGVNIANVQPNYFTNNNSSVPLNDWDFSTVWKTIADGLPQLRAPPLVSTNAATNVTGETAKLQGTLWAVGSHPVSNRGFEYGTSTSYGQTISESPASYSQSKQWGSPGNGNGQFSSTTGVALDNQGNIYTTEGNNGFGSSNRVQKFDSNGVFITKWGSFGTGDGQFKESQGIGISRTNEVYVVDAVNNRIQKFDSDGNFITKWGSFGTGDGQFNEPAQVAIDSTGNVYVTDQLNSRVQKFDNDGNFITKWSSFGTGGDHLWDPFGIAIDSHDRVYVSDKSSPSVNNDRVVKFDNDGNFITEWGSLGSAVGQFNGVVRMTFDKEDNLYAIDLGNGRTQIFTTSGEYVTNFNGTGSSIAVKDDGTVILPGYSEVREYTVHQTGDYALDVSTLDCGATYHFRAFAENIDGIGYGDDLSFNTDDCPSTPPCTGTCPFITTWKTDNPGGSASNQITIPTNGGGYNYDVDWGDTSTSSGQTGDSTHTYSSPGTYTVKITGTFPRIYFCNNGDKDKILTIEQWGANPWTSMDCAFRGVSNLSIPATDTPDLTNVTSMRNIFSSTANFNSDIGSWDVSHVTDMQNAFYYAASFNSDIGAWDVGSVTNMLGMFVGAGSFNQPIDSWDVSSVTTMSNMFVGAASFNQPVNSWHVGQVTNMIAMFAFTDDFNQSLSSWDVGSVTDMSYMFARALSFNQPLGNWDVRNVINMDHMFAVAPLFNQPLSNWGTSDVTNMEAMFAAAASFDQSLGTWDVSNVTNMQYMFGDHDSSGPGPDTSGLSTAHYDATLTGWDAQTLQTGLIFDAGTSTYCDSASQRAHIISTFSWTINDSGENCPPPVSDQTDFRLTQTLTSTGSIVSGDNVTYHFKITNEGPVNSEFIGEMIAVMPTEFTYSSNTNESQVMCTDYGLADNIPSPYWPTVFAGHHVLDCTNAVSNVLINTGQSIEFDVIGSATANFAANSTASKAMYLDVLHETADAGILFTALGSNIDFSTLTINNVSTAIYTHSSGGGGGGGTTPPPSTPKPKPKPTTPKTPPSTSILSPPSASSESAGGPQDSVLKDQISNLAVSKRSGFLQRFSDTAAISINWLLLLILLIIAGLYSWRARREYLARKRLESALSRLRGTKQALDTYLSITTHYLNTPVAIMNGAIELLASLRKLPEWAILNLQSKLKKYAADVTQLGTAAQLVTAGSDTHDLPTSSVTMIGTVSRKPSLIKQRAVWIPVGIVTALIALVTFLFTHAHVYTMSPVQTGLQILCLILAAGLIAFAHHNRDVQLTAQAVAQASLTTEQQLVNQRTTFMSQASAVLADDYENLSIASKDFHIIPETKTFYNGLGMLGASVGSLTKVTQLTNLSSDYPLLNLKQEVTRTLSELQPQTEAKHLQLQVAIPEDLQVSTQPEQIKQLVRSVVDNAIKFNKDGGTVRISAHQARKQVVLRVSDSGIGIPAERLPHMFEPFFRATDTETYDYQGLGLSLYTDKLIVEQLGGKIELSSSPTGTTVQITLPTGRKTANAVPTLVTPTVQTG